ncbi:MAG: 5-oxoprolinase subunit PxpB [Armatimonadota bacterium]|nr:5-oxoprolinase subunit PxpB [Armatimonadota bacterium]
MSGAWPRLLPSGDRGLLVEFPPEVSAENTARVLGADAVLTALPGVVETVPALRSVLVVYDPRVTGFDALAERAEAAVRGARPAALESGRITEVPVAYGGAHGPDLEAVATACGLTPAEVVRLHSAQTYTVYMLGFAPGHPYMGPLAPALRLARRASPRARVPAGSVGIADAFTNIYPQETAGGWHVLGRTSLRLFDPHRQPACLLAPGDRVRFVPVDRVEPPDEVTAAPVALTPRHPVLEVLDPGLLTTVQDLGREGWRRYGVPSSGALDRRACAAANRAVGNPSGAAVLECAFPGPRLRALAEADVAVAGADFVPRHNGRPVDLEDPVHLRPGDVMDFATPRRGQWAYVAVAGGIDAPLIFGSRATYARGGLGGLAGRRVRAGDVLGRGEGRPGPRMVRREGLADHSPQPFRVVLGPQTAAFSTEAQAAWLLRSFAVTARRDRSGMRLHGPVLAHRGGAEILSDGLLPGAVQVPAEGQPIIILADGPTTGGYAKIASVISADLDRLAQTPSGVEVRFEAVTVAEAHHAWIAQTAELTTPR